MGSRFNKTMVLLVALIAIPIFLNVVEVGPVGFTQRLQAEIPAGVVNTPPAGLAIAGVIILLTFLGSAARNKKKSRGVPHISFDGEK